MATRTTPMPWNRCWNTTNARVYIHADEVGLHAGSGSQFWDVNGLFNRVEAISKRFRTAKKCWWGSSQFNVCRHRGHTPGSQCFLIENGLFSGDTLFVDACGRVDMPGGDPRKMWWSLNHTLRALDDTTVVYPGHDYGGSPTSTIGEQKQANPYMRYDSVQQFIQDMA